MNYVEFSKIYSKIANPKIEMHNGVKSYLDPIRKKYISATPEELVRQKTIVYLLNDLKTPQEAIEVEFRLSKAGITDEIQADRADIVIFDRENRALCVIECKANTVSLTDETVDQAIGYSDALETRYMCVVNGIESLTFIYDDRRNEYIPIKKLPVYSKMLANYYDEERPIEKKKRFLFNELSSNCNFYVEKCPVFSEGTTQRDLPFMTNLYECLMLDEHKIPAKNYGYYKLLEDYGERFIKVGNSSGFGYDGEYHSFRVEKGGNVFFMNLSMFDYGRINHTILTVSVERKGRTHNSLQYAFKDARVLGDIYRFIHSGRITIGKYGACKPSELKEFVGKKAPYLLKNGNIDLGVLHNNRLIHMDDEEMIKFVNNLLTYALIREEFRDMMEARKEAEKK